MNIERVRTILGVWAPMAIGSFIIATSINFYVTARLSADLESWRLVCSAGAFFVGSVLMLSTYGRYQKTKAARREAAASSLVPALPPTPQEDRDQQSDGDNHDDQQPPAGG
ncbi:MAG TPA: hypothetical protein VEO96_00870 [Thermoplasmata archaeon]|nr:hypothetical protein [Thermoplasmata archaeon]